MALFLSTFVNKIDKKGRVSVPASFRTSLIPSQTNPQNDPSFSGIVVFRSLKHPALEGCGVDRMQRLSNSIDRLDLFSDAQDDLVSAIFADSHLLSFDSEGRVSIPEDFLKFANLTDQVAFVGRGATFQLWSPTVFQKIQDDARDRLKREGPGVRLTLEEKAS
ncbi:MAG: division/cell wall cluster transcriptional repressor MraZ [Alphaproteobacteria bacterium]|jgi:MraZ protein|nr:division/cell wall cluster transcriptional repressor MraZ [Alphaproteobacteria bacterium]